tara:strand:- start:616 stop:1071 length:456 start_codon:yes stop_codon:yes gene_type:complete
MIKQLGLNLHNVSIIALSFLKTIEGFTLLTILRPFAIVISVLGVIDHLRKAARNEEASDVWQIEKAIVNMFFGPKHHWIISIYKLFIQAFFIYTVYKLKNKTIAVALSALLLLWYLERVDLTITYKITEKEAEWVYSLSAILICVLWITSI